MIYRGLEIETGSKSRVKTGTRLSKESLGVRVEAVNSSLELSGSCSKLESNATVGDSGLEGGDGLKDEGRK